MDNAHIYAGERLELPSNTHKYQHWNVQQLFAAEESFAPFIEAVEEAAGSDDPAEQEAAGHAATVIAEAAPAAVDGMSSEQGGTAGIGDNDAKSVDGNSGKGGGAKTAESEKGGATELSVGNKQPKEGSNGLSTAPGEVGNGTEEDGN